MQKRNIYSHGDLARLLRPGSVAIVGASSRSDTAATRVLKHIEGFGGRVYLVNPKNADAGERWYADLSELPESPDCVIAMTPRESAEEVLESCIAVGAGGLLIFASGFGETGDPVWRARQDALAERARVGGVRLVGPNCAGFINYTSGLPLTFALVPTVSACSPQSIGLISQSGALGFALSQAIYRGVSFSHVLSAGNSCDVDIADYISYLAEDDGCRAIACLFEGISDGERLVQAARKALRLNRPLVVHKMGTGRSGAAAAMSHTGSIAGADEAFRAVFEREGVVIAETYEELIPLASFLAKAGRPAAPGPAVFTTSGGAGILAADCADRLGVPLAPPGTSREVLARLIPHFGSASNPIDVTTQLARRSDQLTECLEALLADPSYNAIVLPVPVASALFADRFEGYELAAARAGKPICIVGLTGWNAPPGFDFAEAQSHLAVFQSIGQCFTALSAWTGWHEARDREPVAGLRTPDPAAQEVGAAIAATGGRAIGERRAKELLARYGIPVVEERPAGSAREATDAAEAIGFPVALKIDSDDIQHKSEVGGLRLSLRDRQEVLAAFDEMTTEVARRCPEARLAGALVQRMVPHGPEILIGGKRDPLFGPLLVVSSGGVLVELMGDAQIALAPVTVDEAYRLVSGLRSFPMLKGYRGGRPVDFDGLTQTIVRVSEFFADMAFALNEIDINPLIAGENGAVVVDALLIPPSQSGSSSRSK